MAPSGWTTTEFAALTSRPDTKAVCTSPPEPNEVSGLPDGVNRTRVIWVVPYRLPLIVTVPETYPAAMIEPSGRIAPEVTDIFGPVAMPLVPKDVSRLPFML